MLDVYFNSERMTIASKLIKEHKNDLFCFLPISETVEVHMLDGDLIIDEISTPRVKSYKYSSLDEILSISKVDVYDGVMGQVLKSIAQLSKDNQNVVLNIAGPITILSSLIDIKVIIKSLKNRKEDLDIILNNIKQLTLDFTKAGIECGASIISLADPTGNMDILGERTYTRLCKNIMLDLISDLQSIIEDKGILHLCGRTTSSLLNLGVIKCERINLNYPMKYGQALLAHKELNVKVVGQNCINNCNEMVNFIDKVNFIT